MVIFHGYVKLPEGMLIYQGVIPLESELSPEIFMLRMDEKNALAK